MILFNNRLFVTLEEDFLGELIRVVDSIEIGSQKFDIELNKSSNGQGEFEIHIQNDKIRLALTEKQFCKIATCILLARKQLHQIKNKQ